MYPVVQPMHREDLAVTNHLLQPPTSKRLSLLIFKPYPFHRKPGQLFHLMSQLMLSESLFRTDEWQREKQSRWAVKPPANCSLSQKKANLTNQPRTLRENPSPPSLLLRWGSMGKGCRLQCFDLLDSDSCNITFL